MTVEKKRNLTWLGFDLNFIITSSPRRFARFSVDVVVHLVLFHFVSIVLSC